MQLWTTTVASARGASRTAQEIEAAAWDGMLVVDSQNLSGDPYVALALAATATTKLGLGTGVTNSVTRHAAVTATAITSVNRVSGGRAVLGIGRGDSALAHLGRAPARLAQFERYLKQLQTYLKGESVSFAEIDIPHDVAPPMSGTPLCLSSRPRGLLISSSGADRACERLTWITSAGTSAPASWVRSVEDLPPGSELGARRALVFRRHRFSAPRTRSMLDESIY